MRTPVESTVRKLTPVEPKPDTPARDEATVSRPFADILAEAESVQDVVRLSGRAPARPVLPGLQDAWDGLRHGVNWMIGAELQPSPVLRSRMRRIGR